MYFTTIFVLLITFAGETTFAIDTVSVDSPELLKGYSLYNDITDTENPTVVKYWEWIVNTMQNSSMNCKEKAVNIWNNWEKFYFSTCGFPNVTAPTFNANNGLLNLWQAWNEDIRADLSNKFKFSVYNKLFLSLKHIYAYNKWYNLYLKDSTKLAQLNNSYYDTAIWLKKDIPDSFLMTQSWSYKINAMDFIWQAPEIAPTHYYTASQSDRYQKFQNSLINIAKKVQTIKNKWTLAKLDSALIKLLKDPKNKIDNDSYLKYMTIYQITLEQEQNN